MLYRFCALALLVFIGPFVAGVEGEESWQAGCAKTIITPQKLIWMAGYGGRDKPAEGKLTELWAKALVLQDAKGHRAVLITLDLVGIARDLAVPICEDLQQKLGLQRDQIAICTSHTHTGPVVAKNLSALHYQVVDEEQRKLITDYAAELRQKVVATVDQAVKNLDPCQVSWGSGRADFAVNRRTNREPEVPEVRTAGTLQGPVDHDVPVLAIHSADGQLKTVVFGYACHATVLGTYQWTADYPGFAQTTFEELHPGCQAMFFAGCAGDQNPLPRRTVELAQHYGRRLATAVEAVVMTSRMQPVTGSLQTRYREIDLPLAPLPSRAEIEQNTKSTNKFEVARAQLLLEQIDAGKPLSPTYPYPVALWQIGPDVSFVILGGEVVVDYAVRLKAELTGTRTWVAGYSNDVMAYIPSRRVLGEGGYEGASSMVYYGLPTTWAPEIENMIVSTVHELVSPEKPNASLPEKAAAKKE